MRDFELHSGTDMKNAGLISLTFDDGLRCQFERAVPVLHRYGFPATFFLVANTDPIHTDGGQHPDWRKIDWKDDDIALLRNLVQQGHEIGAHSVHHRYPFLDDDPKDEAEGSKHWIENRLGLEIVSYCYPFYHVTDPIKNAVMGAAYKQARWGTLDTYYRLHQSLDWFQVDCHQIANNEDVSKWTRQGCWHVLTFHGIGDEQDGWEPIPLHEFARQMAELAKLSDLGAAEVLTFKDAADRMRRNSSTSERPHESRASD